jgi:hypothetical protein
MVFYYKNLDLEFTETSHIISNNFNKYVLDLFSNYKNILLCTVLFERDYELAFMFNNSEDIEKVINKIPKYEIKKLK